uniref:Uncharacterized protein n=1 Tax=Cruciviridae sp. TaxID=1955495 RepID=A0A1S6LVL4_9VIRU|nr:hypothetical protein [Cruciviridae sp.]
MTCSKVGLELVVNESVLRVLENEGLSDEELAGLADVVEYAGWLWGKLLKLKLVHGLLGFSLLLQHLLGDCLVALREL